MTKTLFTTITPLPAGVSRETVLDTLHDHLEMIDLNPTHESRERIAAPRDASAEEYHCTWYQITDKISYLPGYKGKVSFKAVFNDLANGVQTHVYAPMGLSIKERWTIGGNAPGEPVQPAEIGIGAPVSGLYLREDVEINCNFMLTKFVRKQLKDALAILVARLLVKSQLVEAVEANKRLTVGAGSAYGGGLGSQLGRSQYGSQHGGGSSYGGSQHGGSQHGGSEYAGSEPPNSPRLPMSPPLSAGLNMSFPKPQGGPGGPPQRLSEQYQDGNQQYQPPQHSQQYQQQPQYQHIQPPYQQNLQQYQQPYQQSPPQKFQQPQGPHPSKFISEMEGSQRHPQSNHVAPVELA